MVAWVGRMQLAPDEVLELLLTGFGISRQAKGLEIRELAVSGCCVRQQGKPLALVAKRREKALWPLVEAMRLRQ